VARWKGFQLDFDKLSSLGGEQDTYCLSPQTRDLCISLLRYADWPTRYHSHLGADIERDVVESWTATALAELMEVGCTMLRLRQDPNNSCVLQVSYDGGETWQTAFNYSLCDLGGSTVEIAQQYYEGSVFVGDSMTLYDGDITNNYPQWEYGDLNDADRDAVICWACKLWVGWCCDTAIKIKTDENSDTEDLVWIAAAVTFAAGSVLLYLTGAGVFAAAMSYAGLGMELAPVIAAVIDLFLTPDIAAFQDQEARDRVACRLYLALAGETPTYTTWRTAADGELSGNSESIRAICYELMQSEEAFVLFLTMMGDLIDIAIAGLLTDECIEGCDEWEYLIDLSVDDGGFVVQQYNGNDYGGYYVPGNYWQEVAPKISTPTMIIGRDLGADTNITELQVNITVNCGSDSVVDRANGVGWELDGGGWNWHTVQKGCPGTQHENFTVTYPNVNQTVDKILATAGIGAQGTGAYGRIHWVMVRGTGTNPFL